ncbi:hypothetical protein DYI37_19125 [Fulvimarina endophytica]|uniref:DUF533 domain-containing protein n=1 Tax=Fulvimarina endophytica TaxID=2293836 RepID=A0A371WXY1_9HYPH|nr:hypothetical protein [Fulvimarina endophytica]RFC61860.1 hypothetical protein DYI37_19125 [Fulvimarina endophytica]
MKVVEWLLNYGARQRGPRDGTAPALEMQSQGLPPVSGPVEANATLRERLRFESLDLPMARVRREQLDRKLAEKVLGAYLSNRVQTASPLTVNFSVLDDAQASLLLETAVHAVQAAGRTNALDDAAILERLYRFKTGAREVALLSDAERSLRPLAQLAPDLLSANLAGRAYAIAASLLFRRDDVSSLFLAYLGARLGLGDDEARLIRRRYRN